MTVESVSISELLEVLDGTPERTPTQFPVALPAASRISSRPRSIGAGCGLQRSSRSPRRDRRLRPQRENSFSRFPPLASHDVAAPPRDYPPSKGAGGTRIRFRSKPVATASSPAARGAPAQLPPPGRTGSDRKGEEGSDGDRFLQESAAAARPKLRAGSPRVGAVVATAASGLRQGRFRQAAALAPSDRPGCRSPGPSRPLELDPVRRGLRQRHRQPAARRSPRRTSGTA